MAKINGSPAGPDGSGGAFLNTVESDRAALWDALGARQGALRGLAHTGIAGQMALTLSPGAAMVAERDNAGGLLNRGYHLWTDDATVVQFAPASAQNRVDALVAAFVDTEDGPVGTGALEVGPHLVAIQGTSGVTTPMSDSAISTYLGRGGWVRLLDVPVAPSDTQINLANITNRVTYVAGVWQSFTPKVYAGTNLNNPVASTPNPDGCKWVRLSTGLVVAQAEVTITNAASTPHIDLPVPAKTRQLNIGTCGLWGATTPADQSGQAYMATTLDKLVCAVAWTQGWRDSAAGTVCRYSVMYEPA